MIATHPCAIAPDFQDFPEFMKSLPSTAPAGGHPYLFRDSSARPPSAERARAGINTELQGIIQVNDHVGGQCFLFQHTGQGYTRFLPKELLLLVDEPTGETVQDDADERHRDRCGRGTTRATATRAGSAEVTAKRESGKGRALRKL